MKVLITGIAGFVGNFLCHELLQAGHEAVGIDLSLAKCPNGVSDALEVDLTNAASVGNAIQQLRPEAVIHLGGIASPPVGRKKPELMLNTNIMGTSYILEALQRIVPQARMLLASTSYIYGNAETERPLTEDEPIAPIGVYAVSKAGADMMTLAYARERGMHAMVARPANHTGPGQSTAFVVPAFAHQLKEIRNGHQQPLMRVGNLDSERTFMDVRDVVRAYRLLIEKGQAGNAYNIATDNRMPIRSVLNKLCQIAGVSPEIQTDPELFRPTDRAPILSAKKIFQLAGWQPEIPLSTTLEDIFDKA
jgi:GDP-4-dehydro-6-deoxy-D-mannose reductase